MPEACTHLDAVARRRHLRIGDAPEGHPPYLLLAGLDTLSASLIWG
jgi:hypothetical protein